MLVLKGPWFGQTYAKPSKTVPGQTTRSLRVLYAHSPFTDKSWRYQQKRENDSRNIDQSQNLHGRLSRLFQLIWDGPISRWGENGRTPRKTTWHTRKQNLAGLTCGQSGARTHTRHSGEMIEWLRNSALNRSATGAARSASDQAIELSGFPVPNLLEVEVYDDIIKELSLLEAVKVLVGDGNTAYGGWRWIG